MISSVYQRGKWRPGEKTSPELNFWLLLTKSQVPSTVLAAETQEVSLRAGLASKTTGMKSSGRWGRDHPNLGGTASEFSIQGS